MIQRLGYDAEKEGAAEEARKKLDAQLKVKRWRIVPAQPDPYAGAPVDDGAPWWWDGEQEASDSFLTAMGVNL